MGRASRTIVYGLAWAAIGCGRPAPVAVTPSFADRDHDGVRDEDDRCPDALEDRDGFEDEDGCPDLDNDKDGIPDVDDQCPNAPEVYNGFEDQDGCPDHVHPQFPTETTIEGVVLFGEGSAVRAGQAAATVDAVAAYLKANPQVVLLQIEGHADEPGKPEALLQLSQSRADAVRKMLIARGTDEARVRAKGFGAFCPRDPASTAANRRVEFRVAKGAEGPMTTGLGCAAATSAGVTSAPVQ